MTDLILFVYVLDLVDTLHNVLVLFLSLLTTVVVFLCVDYVLTEVDDKPLVDGFGSKLRNSKLFYTIALLLVFAKLFLPTKDTLLLMGGIYYGNKTITAIADTPLVEKSLKLLETKLDEELKRLEQ